MSMKCYSKRVCRVFALRKHTDALELSEAFPPGVCKMTSLGVEFRSDEGETVKVGWGKVVVRDGNDFLPMTEEEFRKRYVQVE